MMRVVVVVLLAMGIPDAALGQPALQPATRPAPYPAPVVWVETFERNGPFFRGGTDAFWARRSLGWPTLDAQVGWAIRSAVSVFATGSTGLLFGRHEPAGFTLGGGGVRLWRDAVYLEARVARMVIRTTCDFDEPCVDRKGMFALAGIGREFGRHPYIRADIHGHVVRMSDGLTGVMVGFAMSFYPFQRASSRYRRL
jgi:hypothetical protein